MMPQFIWIVLGGRADWDSPLKKGKGIPLSDAALTKY